MGKPAITGPASSGPVVQPYLDLSGPVNHLRAIYTAQPISSHGSHHKVWPPAGHQKQQPRPLANSSSSNGQRRTGGYVSGSAPCRSEATTGHLVRPPSTTPSPAAGGPNTNPGRQVGQPRAGRSGSAMGVALVRNLMGRSYGSFCST
ncbi:hypothetical protein RHMOL_Rhmol03G0159900 [Rhododendron molle]|uniref:Uncharacterized protein n=1 Tax=Rhododendron molle TaxID=49168 RepID=A0ACC0PER9_RHOML|nr:hypothetical protein RHMOL_Rhmol03G0159900 [Rhododendron molle]